MEKIDRGSQSPLWGPTSAQLIERMFDKLDEIVDWINERQAAIHGPHRAVVDEYEFHEDWDINTIFVTSDVERSETEIKMFFRDEIERMIPPEYQDKIEYHCKLNVHNNRFDVWWLYPGKRLAQEAKK